MNWQLETALDSTDSISDRWPQNPVTGEEKLFHKPSQKHSGGGWCVTVKICKTRDGFMNVNTEASQQGENWKAIPRKDKIPGLPIYTIPSS